MLTNFSRNIGIIAMSARNIAPTNVILLSDLTMKSVVGLPGLIPGMKPPYFFIPIGILLSRSLLLYLVLTLILLLHI